MATNKTNKVLEYSFDYSDNSKSHNALSWHILELYCKMAGHRYSQGVYMTVTKKMGSNALIGKNGYTSQGLNALIGVDAKLAKQVSLTLWNRVNDLCNKESLFGKANNDSSKAMRILSACIGNKTIDGRDQHTCDMVMTLINELIAEHSVINQQQTIENNG